MNKVQRAAIVLLWIAYMWMNHIEWTLYHLMRRMMERWNQRLMNSVDLGAWEESHNIDYLDYIRVIP